MIKQIMEYKIKTMQESWPFLKPVSRKNVKNYYETIKQPMDLEMIEKKVLKHQYHNREEFLGDIELIYSNRYKTYCSDLCTGNKEVSLFSVQFNGENSEFSLKAKKILDVTKEALAPYDAELAVLEEGIKEVQNAMLEQAEMESLGASLGEDSAPGLTPKSSGSKKRGRPRKAPLSQEFVPNSDDEEQQQSPSLGKRKTKKSAEAAAAEAAEAALIAAGGSLADDLRYSSDEDDDDGGDDEDWQAVEDDEEEEEGLTVTIEGVDAGGQEAQNVVIEEGQIVDIGKITL